MSETELCRVCGAPGAQFYYRGLVCGSCRVFFIRTVQRTGIYTCEFAKECIIKPGSKSNCKACRYAKCLEANMTEKDVGRFKKETKSTIKEQTVVPYFSQHDIDIRKGEIIDSLSIGFKFIDRLGRCPNATEYARELIAIESLCDNLYGPRPEQVFFDINASFADVLRNPQLCCDRSSVSWNLPTEVVSMVDLLRTVYCRSITLYTDFISTCPELNELPDRDRIALCSANFCNVILLTMSYNGWRRGIRGILFPHGIQLTDEAFEGHEVDKFLVQLVRLMKDLVVPIFDRTKMTPEEYTLLKMISLFSAATESISEDGQQVARKAKSRYSRMLAEHINDAYPWMRSIDKSRRLSELLSIIPHLLTVSLFDNEYCIRMNTLNLGNMKGRLSYDLHVRHY